MVATLYYIDARDEILVLGMNEDDHKAAMSLMVARIQERWGSNPPEQVRVYYRDIPVYQPETATVNITHAAQINKGEN